MGLVGTIARDEERSAVSGSALCDFGLKVEVPTEGDMLDDLDLDHAANFDPLGSVLLVVDGDGTEGTPQFVGIVEIGDIGLVERQSVAKEDEVEVVGTGAVVVDVVGEADFAERGEVGLEVELLLLACAILQSVVGGFVGYAHAEGGHGEEAVVEVGHHLCFEGGMLEVERVEQGVEDIDRDIEAVEEAIAVLLTFGQHIG